jgi:hypothetical protein
VLGKEHTFPPIGGLIINGSYLHTSDIETSQVDPRLFLLLDIMSDGLSNIRINRLRSPLAIVIIFGVLFKERFE